MTLELNRLVQAVQAMGQALARQQEDFGQLVTQARAWLDQFADQGANLRAVAAEADAAIPTDEPLNGAFPLPPLPERFTAIGADGSQIGPDRHGAALYYLINVGSLVYRHGSGEAPVPRSIPRLYYEEKDLYEGRMLVQGNLLDVRRDRAEIAHLADRVEEEPEGPVLALVDGTLLLWVLENLSADTRTRYIQAYLKEMERIRRRGAALAAFTSRPRSTEVGRLLHLAQCGGDKARAEAEPNPLERVPDRAIFSFLPPGARSALFVAPGSVNPIYRERGHEILFFYLNVASAGEEPVVARVEVPRWVAERPKLLALAHGGVVAQCRIAGGFPYVLARADELAFIRGPERERLGEMIEAALLAAGLPVAASPKARYKRLTRRGRRRIEFPTGRW